MVPATSQNIVIGGGFYGCCLAIFLRQAGQEVTLLEQEEGLLMRASYANQARVHYGYHYPRSLATGLSCVLNFPRFVMDFRSAIVDRFTKIYAVARLNSKVTANQFFGYCRRIGAPIRRARPACRNLFNSDLIEEVFEVKEFAFDASKLRSVLKRRLAKAGVTTCHNVEVRRVIPGGSGLDVELQDGNVVACRSVYNCTYAGINAILRRSGVPTLPMKYEVAEIALIRPPDELAGLGVTVVDGPYFSTMPFPAESVYSLSHVRYTPHYAWSEVDGQAAGRGFSEGRVWSSNFSPMVKDASRYMPSMQKARHVRSLFETKTVLLENERNDGRPILLRTDYVLKGLHVVMGGKIDNIYDVFRALRMIKDLARGSSETDRTFGPENFSIESGPSEQRLQRRSA